MEPLSVSSFEPDTSSTSNFYDAVSNQSDMAAFQEETVDDYHSNLDLRDNQEETDASTSLHYTEDFVSVDDLAPSNISEKNNDDSDSAEMLNTQLSLLGPIEDDKEDSDVYFTLDDDEISQYSHTTSISSIQSTASSSNSKYFSYTNEFEELNTTVDDSLYYDPLSEAERATALIEEQFYKSWSLRLIKVPEQLTLVEEIGVKALTEKVKTRLLPNQSVSHPTAPFDYKSLLKPMVNKLKFKTMIARMDVDIVEKPVDYKSTLNRIQGQYLQKTTKMLAPRRNQKFLYAELLGEFALSRTPPTYAKI